MLNLLGALLTGCNSGQATEPAQFIPPARDRNTIFTTETTPVCGEIDGDSFSQDIWEEARDHSLGVTANYFS